MSLGTIGKYERLDVIGHGASGIVYLARDTLLRRQVAIKEISAQGEERDRFLEEARVLDRLRHQNIVEVHSVDTINGKIVIDMEYVDGENLLEMIRRTDGPLQIATAIDITVQVLDGLAFAQARHIVHRDIKPANILVSKVGQVKLVDFGLAEVLGTNSFVGGAGTYAYMAPEDFEEGESSDQQADIWAVGVILYEMLTGRRPFSVAKPKDPFSWKRAIESGAIRPASLVNSEVPEAIDDILAEALARDRAQRFRTAAEFANALNRFKMENLGSGAKAAWPSVRDEPRQSQPPNLIGATDIDTFLNAAPERWEEARSAMSSGLLSRWLWSINEAPLAEIAQKSSEESADEHSDDDALLRDFLYRAGLDVSTVARNAANTGSSFLRAGAYDDAAESLMQAIRLDPNHVSYFRQLHKALTASGDTAAANAVIARGLEYHPKDRALRKEQAEIGLIRPQISQKTVDFGTLRHGEQAASRVFIRNLGVGILQGRVASLPGWIQATPMSFSTRHRQPIALVADTSDLFDREQEYNGAITLDTNGGSLEVHVNLTVKPPRPAFQDVMAWYLPLIIVALFPLLGSEFATLRHHHHGMVPYYSVGLVVSGLMLAAVWKVTAVADIGPAERFWPALGGFLAPLGIWLCWLNRDHRALWVALLISAIPAGILLVAQGFAMLRAPLTWGRWPLWGWAIGLASALLTALFWQQTKLPVVQ